MPDQVIGNIIAKLAQNGELAGGWFGSIFIFFHTRRVAWQKPSGQPFLHRCGMPV